MVRLDGGKTNPRQRRFILLCLRFPLKLVLGMLCQTQANYLKAGYSGNADQVLRLWEQARLPQNRLGLALVLSAERNNFRL